MRSLTILTEEFCMAIVFLLSILGFEQIVTDSSFPVKLSGLCGTTIE